MPTDCWARMPLGDFVTLQRGHDLPDEQRRPGGIPILGSFGVTGWHDEAKALGPGVTVGRSGASFGVATYSQTDFWPLNTALYVIDFHGNNERFAYYFLKAFDFGGYNSGSAQPSLNCNFVHPIPVVIPPPAEQRAIAGVLGALDDKIELNRRLNETLEAMAQALFKSWFVNFDPVRAKAEGCDPGLPEPIADLFPARFVDCELGEIPEGWEVDRLESAAELVRVQANPFEMPDRVFSHYSIPAFDNGQLPLAELGITIKSMKFCVPPGTVLFSKLNPTIERVWFVDPQTNEGAVCSTEFLVLRPKAPFGRSFLYCLLRSPNFREAVNSLVTGTSNSHQRARADGILEMVIAFPPAGLAERFEDLAGPILDGTLANRGQSKTLAKIRDLLLPKLISGDLRVKEAERVVAEAAG